MKKILALLLTAALSLGTLAACGTETETGNETKNAETEAPAVETTGETETEDPATELTVIKVAASTTPHAEILEKCVEPMKAQGYDLQILTMDDYVTPNTAVESHDVDANYFQHTPYLDQFNEENGTSIVSVAKVHYEPYAIYAGTCDSLEALEDGASIAVPNDATNEARALLLLEAAGLIELSEDAGLTATTKDIVSNPKNFDIKEMEAALIPSVLDEVAVAVINGNYAIGAGLKVYNSLVMEDPESEAAQTYANILAVAAGSENEPGILALVDILHSEDISDFINDTYEKAVLPIR